MQALYPLNFQKKSTITFCGIWVFLSTNGFVVKDQVVRVQVPSTFSEGPSCRLTYDENFG